MFTFVLFCCQSRISPIVFRMSLPGGSQSSPFFSTRSTRSIAADPTTSLKEKLDKTEAKTKATKKRVQADIPAIQPAKSTTTSLKKRDINIPATSTTTDDSPKLAKWEPKDWQSVLEKLRQMRSSRPAPVDTMGCHMCSDPQATPQDKRFHILVALMLSSQTKDEVET